MKVSQVFIKPTDVYIPDPHRLIQGTRKVGLEVELENIQSWDFDTLRWRVTEDGSLRNSGAEFVLNGPQGGKDLYEACTELDTFLSSQKPDPSWRCSVHCHVDVRDLNADQVRKVILTYLAYEKILFRITGFERFNNNFCQAIGFAQYQLDTLAQIWNSGSEVFLLELCNRWNKYSALNFLPLQTFGSIEFRLSSAVWNKSKLMRTANRYLSLVDFGASWEGSERELLEALSVLSPKDILGKGVWVSDIPSNWEEDLSTGLKLAHDVLAMSTLYPPVIFDEYEDEDDFIEEDDF